MRLEVEKNTSQVLAPAKVLGQSEHAGTSSNVAELLNLGIRAAQCGDRAEARAALFRVTEADPKNEAAWLWLASISEYPEELLVFLNNILDINPENARAIEWKMSTNSLLAKTFVQRGIDAAGCDKGDFAIECFNRALEFDENNEIAWLWKASLADSADNRITYLESVLRINPQNEAAARAFLDARKEKTAEHLANAKTAAVEGRKDKAYELLKSVIEEDPACEDAWLLRSHFADSLDEKILSFQRVLEINPTNQGALVSLDSLNKLVGLAPPEPRVEDNRPSFASEFHRDPTLSYEPEMDRIPTQDLEIPPAIVDELKNFESRSSSLESVENGRDNQISLDESGQVEETEAVGVVEQPPFVGRDSSDHKADFDSALNWTVESEVAAEITSFLPVAPTDEPEPAKYVPTFAVLPFAAEETPSNGYEVLTSIEPELAQEESVDETIEVSSPVLFESPKVETTAFRVEEVEEAIDEYSVEMPATYATYPEGEQGQIPEEAARESSDLHEVEMLDVVAEEVDLHEEARADDFALQTPEVTEQSIYSSASITIPATVEADQVEEAPEDPYKTVSLSWTDIPGSSPWESIVAETTEDIDPEKEFIRDETVAEHPLSTLCAFCGSTNDYNSITCTACFAILTLSDLDMIIGNSQADKQLIKASVERMEELRGQREFDESELTMLGIGHLNLQQLQTGYERLHEASKINPNNVVLSSQVNSLLIKIEDIRKHDETMGSMTKGKTILVVDDSPTVRKLISGKLEKCGHEVFCSSDGIEALEVLDSIKPDLVLLDISMPNMDGYQTCKAIRNMKDLAGVPIVMISGKDGFFDKVRGKMAGTSGYITKPFGPETLMKTVETFLAAQTPEMFEMPEATHAEV